MMKYPEMRQELLGYLEGLSDIEYQKRCWLEGDCPDGVEHDELDYAVHFLFDDTSLSDEPSSLIGHILRNEDEAKYISRLCDSLNSIFEQYGTEVSDEKYLSVPEWRTVIKCAEEAKRIFIA